MKTLILPVVMLLLGSGAGVGAGLFLAPPETAPADADAAAEDTAETTTEPAPEVDADSEGETEGDSGEEIDGQEYVRLNNQFVVPVVAETRVVALVVLSLSLEVTAGSRETVFSREPKLRDAFLQVLFDHANVGGFSGNFTSSSNMRVLRTGLRDAARDVLGERITDVLIMDVVRQDVQD